MPKRARRRRTRSPRRGPSTVPPPLGFGAEFLAWIEARDHAEATRTSLENGRADTEASIIRSLAAEAARGADPVRFVQVRRQLDAWVLQHEEQLDALSEIGCRFQQLIDQARAERGPETLAAIQERIAQLEARRQLPGAPVAEIAAEMERWERELDGAAGSASAPAAAKRKPRKAPVDKPSTRRA